MHRTGRRSTYDKAPVVPVGDRVECSVGWAEIGARITAGDPKFADSQDLPAFPYAEYARLLGLKGLRVE